MVGLDRFVYVYEYLRSRLSRPSCFYHSIAGPKKCPRVDRSKAGRSGFRRGTVFKNFNSFQVMCRTGGEGAKGISCLLVEKEKTPGSNFSTARFLG